MLAVVSWQSGQLQLCCLIQQQTTAWPYPVLLCGRRRDCLLELQHTCISQGIMARHRGRMCQRRL